MPVPQTGNVVLSGHIDVPKSHIDAVVSALPSHIELTQAEPGCLYFAVVADPSTPRRYLVHELFMDQQSFEYHQERTGASQWAVITKDVSRHYQVTVID